MPWPTKVFRSWAAWQKAGSPVGGVFPVTKKSRAMQMEEGGWPERYRDTPAWWVALPNGQHWCPWARAFSKEQGHHGEGWEISGQIPDKMTVTPSINASEGAYHGFLTDGVLSDG